MKIQITALVLLVATLAACDAAPVEETSSSPGPIDALRAYGQQLYESAQRIIADLRTHPTIQSGSEWIQSHLEQVPELIQAKREELSQALQQFTGQDGEQ